MKNEFDDFNIDDVSEFLNKNHTDSEEEQTGSFKELDNSRILENEIAPLVEQIGKIARENDMDFLFAIKDNQDDSGGYSIKHTGYIVDKTEHPPVCEFLACITVLRAHHQFSHEVILNSAVFHAKNIIDRIFGSLFKDNGQEDDE